VTRSASAATDVDGVPVDARPIASGKRLVVSDGRYRVYRPHNSALSVLIIRRAKKRDAGIYRCNLAGSTTRHKYMVLNVTGEYAVPDLRRDLDEATLALENCSGEGTIF